MARRDTLKRKAFFINEDSLRRARRALGVKTDADAVRLSLEFVAEMNRFWRFMDRSRGRLRHGSFEAA